MLTNESTDTLVAGTFVLVYKIGHHKSTIELMSVSCLIIFIYSNFIEKDYKSLHNKTRM